MGITAAVVSAVVGVSSYMEAKEARQEQAAAQGRAQSEQKASSAAQAAQERRNQIREERVRRARIMQGSMNTGGTGSSAEFGATSNLATGLGANLGANLGALQTASNISTANQQAATAGLEAQEATSMFQLSSSIFSSVGGPEKAQNLFK